MFIVSCTNAISFSSAVNCQPLPSIPDGNIVPASCTNDEVISGTKCHVNCREGYKLQGQKVLTCTDNAQWDPGDTAGSICIGNVKALFVNVFNLVEHYGIARI